MVPCRVHKMKIDHGHHFFIAPFVTISLLMIATLAKYLYILTLCNYLNPGHNLLRCALITSCIHHFRHFLFKLCSDEKFVRAKSVLTRFVAYSSMHKKTLRPPSFCRRKSRILSFSYNSCRRTASLLE